MKKILFVIPSLTQTNGIPSFLINYLSYIDLKKFDITVLTSNLRPSKNHINFFKNNNIKLFFVSDFRREGLIKYWKSLKKFFKNNHDYDLIYSNVANQSLFIFFIAKIYGIENYALHSHATISSASRIKRVLNDFLTKIILKRTKYFISCSEIAGKAMFRKKNFYVINNAIDYNKYEFSVNDRENIRNKLNIKNDEKVIGYVGRFAQQKNIYFFKKLAEKLEDNYKILMIGTGDLKESFINQIIEAKLENRFVFVDECDDVNRYYSAMDCFMLPSHFEGLPVVSIEAQANRLICFLSDTISKECKILETTKFLNRNNIELWKYNLLNCNLTREINNKEELNDKFNIRIQASKFENKLLKMCNGK